MWVGTVLAMVGLAMVAEVWQGLRLDALGLLLGVGAALCAAAYFLIGERGRQHVDPLGLVTWGMVVGAVAISVLAPPWSLPVELLAVDADFGASGRCRCGCCWSRARSCQHGAGVPAVDQRAAGPAGRTW